MKLSKIVAYYDRFMIQNYNKFLISSIMITLSEKAKTIKKGKYRHYKGNEYEVLGVGLKEDDLSEYVIYQTMKVPLLIFLRPIENFLEIIELNNEKIRRFSSVDKE